MHGTSGKSVGRPRVLVMADWYAPGFRAGGPIRSVVNFAEQLEDVLDIFVFTTDRDLGSDGPYEGIQANQWIDRSGHKVYYASPDRLSFRAVLGVIRSLQPAHIYLNSMFSRYMTFYPLLMHRLGLIGASILLAPRGMLMDSALSVKSQKKRIFLAFLKLLGIPSRIRFQATNEGEVDEVYRAFGVNTPVVRLDNLPGRLSEYIPPPLKARGCLKVVFVGRCHPIKNLDLLLHAIEGVTSRIELTVVMTREDEVYEKLCRGMADRLHSRHEVVFSDGLPNEEIQGILRSNHIFALPSRGENFGHSILEALSAGRPVMISDQTPWRGLEESHAGWDLPIHDYRSLTDCLEKVAVMDHARFTEWCEGAWKLAHEYMSRSQLRESYVDQFE